MTTGSILRAAREQAGMSLEDVADGTKIRPSILAAMEEDDFSHCGGDVYARGQIKSVAQVLGIDPEDALDAFADRR